MSLTVSVFLLAILYVGIGAISGLEVSYAAFKKEVSHAENIPFENFMLMSTRWVHRRPRERIRRLQEECTDMYL